MNNLDESEKTLRFSSKNERTIRMDQAEKTMRAIVENDATLRTLKQEDIEQVVGKKATQYILNNKTYQVIDTISAGTGEAQKIGRAHV